MSTLISLVLIEIILRNSIEFMPLKYQEYLPSDVAILSQHTKDQLVPEPYVALLGDSYAAGWGDWYRASLDEAPLGNPPFHSADVIHGQAGLNVLTFARPGQGSFDGIAYFPVKYHQRLLSRGFPLADPELLIIYFYEGNDVTDNLQFLDRYGNGDGLLTLEEVEYLVETMPAGDLREHSAVVGYLRGLEILQQLYVAKFLYVLGKDVVRLLSQAIDAGSAPPQDQVSPIRVRIGGKTLQIPGPVETPPVYLTDSEIARAMSVFESSSRYLLKHYSNSKLFFVYVPSPIMSYQLETAAVPVATPDGSILEYQVSQVESVSDGVCERIAEVAVRLGATFFDARPPIRTAGQAEIIHGPNDWYHFNEIGYKVLGSIIARHLTDTFSNLSTNEPVKLATGAPLANPQCAHIAK